MAENLLPVWTIWGGRKKDLYSKKATSLNLSTRRGRGHNKVQVRRLPKIRLQGDSSFEGIAHKESFRGDSKSPRVKGFPPRNLLFA